MEGNKVLNISSYDTDSTQSEKMSEPKSRKTLKILLVIIFALCFIGTVVGIPLAMTYANGGKDSTSTVPPTTRPTTPTRTPEAPSRACGKNFGDLEYDTYPKVSVLSAAGQIMQKKNWFPGSSSRKRRTAEKPHPRDDALSRGSK